MSHRPIRRKQANRLRKALRATPETFIDLVAYLKDRGHADTTRQAEEIILAGRVRSESHTLGITEGRRPKQGATMKLILGRPLTDDDYEDAPVVDRLVPAKLRETIQVVSA